MIRIRIGQSWAHDPFLRAAAASREGALDEPGRLVDAFALEVDGVDLAAGRAERNAFSGARALVDAAARLMAGEAREEVAFPEGEVQLLLRRRGAAVLLSVVALSPPARLLARDVEVELRELAAAVAAAAQELVEALAVASPGLARRPGPAALRRAAASLAQARLAPAAPLPPAASAPPAAPGSGPVARPTCDFELEDEEGLVESYRGPGADLGSLLAPGRVRLAFGGEPLVVEAPPFLALRELARLAEQVVEATRRGGGEVRVEVPLPGRGRTLRLALDLDRRTLSAGAAARPVDPLALACAVHEAALALADALVARNPRQARNPWLADLREAAAARLTVARELAQGDLAGEARATLEPAARATLPPDPLGPGRMKRLTFRRAWELDVGAPAGQALVRHGARVLAAGEGGTAAVEAGSGRIAWRAPGASWSRLAGDLWLALEGEALCARGPEDGALRWRLPLRGEVAAVTGAARLGPGPLLLLAGGVVLAVDPGSGAVAWRFERAAAPVAWVAGFGALAVAAGASGTLYALDAAGRVVWRVHGPAPLVAPPLAWGESVLALCRGDRDGYLLALDPGSGRRRFETPLQFAPAGPPLPLSLPGLLAVGGGVAGDPVVAAVDPGGAVAWTTAPGLGDGGAPALSPLDGGLVAKGSGGALTALEADGSARWSAAATARHPPPGNLPAQAVRGLVVSPAEEVAVYRAAGGEKVGVAPLPAPVRLLVDEALGMIAMDAAGVVTAVQVATHLSVV